MRMRRTFGSRRRTRSQWRRWAIAAFAIPMVLLGAGVAYAKTRGQAADDLERPLQEAMDELRVKLGITQAVRVSLVPHNPHVFSVRPADEKGVFIVQVDAEALKMLTPDELHAALAHELGHVWVYTHHPYLQTERLANDVARRVVSRDSLASVYEKVWRAQGVKGSLARFLGE